MLRLHHYHRLTCSSAIVLIALPAVSLAPVLDLYLRTTAWCRTRMYVCHDTCSNTLTIDNAAADVAAYSSLSHDWRHILPSPTSCQLLKLLQRQPRNTARDVTSVESSRCTLYYKMLQYLAIQARGSQVSVS